ncbi:MAG: hypothetical protein DMD78_02230 [Candidatus Rokuibacteriota bacterium]|nr:MAG: hypothetical protein DMD78_02230 [Candidatus Rokubacteria bacterium]
MSSLSWTPVMMVIGLVLVIGAAGFAGLYFFAVRSRRDDEASALQQALTEPLAREPALAGAGVLVVVTAPWRGRPRVELTGWAPSPEMRDAAVRAIAREASRLGRPVRMIDHLEILDRSARRPA